MSRDGQNNTAFSDTPYTAFMMFYELLIFENRYKYMKVVVG